ncbi:fibronectin type III domain-containing protein [Bacillus sp. SCS-151]|uniref:fibronectin type III domain-containing protein n=1 Tax=Nanhaiella sioensis TaxID=3115293 RepID=UPI00397B91B1
MKSTKKFLGFMIFSLFALVVPLVAAPNVASAEVGDQFVDAPEEGWTRYDDRSDILSFENEWTFFTDETNLYYSDDSYAITKIDGAKVKFNFTGSNIRLIGPFNFGGTQNSTIKIDDQIYPLLQQHDSIPNAHFQSVYFEQLGLDDKEHSVEITYAGDGTQFIFDAIDIAQNGELLPYNENIEPEEPGDTNTFNLVATPEDWKISLTWDEVEGASQYAVLRSTTSGGPYEEVGNIFNDSTETYYLDSTVEYEETYYYVIRATGLTIEDVFSNEVSTTPDAVREGPILVATPGDSEIILTWDEVEFANGYALYKSTTQGEGYELVSVDNPSENFYTDINVDNGVTYYYYVSAYGKHINNIQSNEASATPESSQVVEDGSAILTITLDTGLVKEYDVTMTTVEEFISWYENRANGEGPSTFAIDTTDETGEFVRSTDYIIFDSVLMFEVDEY